MYMVGKQLPLMVAINVYMALAVVYNQYYPIIGMVSKSKGLIL